MEGSDNPYKVLNLNVKNGMFIFEIIFPSCLLLYNKPVKTQVTQNNHLFHFSILFNLFHSLLYSLSGLSSALLHMVLAGVTHCVLAGLKCPN